MAKVTNLPSKAKRIFQNQGTWPLVWNTLRYTGAWDAIWNTVTSRHPIGENIFERDWDLLIILDTCRVSSLNSLSDAQPWLDSAEPMQSVGSMSAEWMLNTFTEEYLDDIKNTAFVSGNIWSHRIFVEKFHTHNNHNYNIINRGIPDWNPVSSENFAHYETVSAIENQNDRLHPQNEAIPHILTDRAISVGRNKRFDRLIVHYTLPHLTFIADALEWEFGELCTSELMSGPSHTRKLKPEELSYRPVEKGEVSPKIVRDHYLNNLRLALDYVKILINNIEAPTTIISADHGEALGEARIWGHPYAYPFGSVKTVPWVELSAEDQQTYKSKHDQLSREPNKSERKESLRQMGYL